MKDDIKGVSDLPEDPVLSEVNIAERFGDLANEKAGSMRVD